MLCKTGRGIAIVGANGAEGIAPFEINEEEQQALYQSSVALKKVIDDAL